MDLSSFVYQPVWSKCYANAALAAACFAVPILARLCLAWTKRRRSSHPKILLVDPDLFLDSVGSTLPAPKPTVEPEEIDLNGDLSNPLTKGTLTSSGKTQDGIAGRVVLRSFGVLLPMLGIILGLCSLRIYVILDNWDEGDRKNVIGDHVGAIVCYKKALRVDTNLLITHKKIATALVQSGKLSTAIPELQLVAFGNGVDAHVAAQLGDVYQTLGRFNDACEAYRAAAKADPAEPSYRIGEGATLEKLGWFDEAYAAYMLALANPGQNTLAHVRIGVLLVRNGHPIEALAHLQHAAEIAPRSDIVHNALCFAYYRLERYSEAMAEARKCISFNPNFAEAWYNLGMIQQTLGKQKDAIESFTICANCEGSETVNKLAIRLAMKEKNRLIVGY